MTKAKKYLISGKIWRYPGPAGWFFLNLGKRDSEEIKWINGKNIVGWGYVRVSAKIKRTIWETTLFPTKEGKYLISIKALVRKKENIKEGDKINLELKIL